MKLIPLLKIAEALFFIYLGLSVFYLFIFAFFSRFKRADQYPLVDVFHRLLVLFPAYKEDRVIVSSVRSFLNQNYPRDRYKIAVISDQMTKETNDLLVNFPILVFDVNFRKSTKAKALNFAMENITDPLFDIVVILDADNTVNQDFLDQINRSYHAGAMAIQAHRKAKNVNTDVAMLDAVSEEMNNAYFRKGHVFLGLSSALSGSGMAFDYNWFRENIRKVSSAGEDKELERLLLKQRVYIEYLNEVPVYDEKVQNSSAFYSQRRRWLAAQFGTLGAALKELPSALRSRNIDYTDKLFQWMMLPRILLLGFIFVFSILIPVINIDLALKWWILLGLLLITFGLAIPRDLDNRALEKAIRKIPLLFILMFLNMFRLRGINKSFIHTSHSVTSDKNLRV